MTAGRLRLEIDADVIDGEVWIKATEIVAVLRLYADQLEHTPPEALIQWSAADALASVRGYLRSEADTFDRSISAFPLAP